MTELQVAHGLSLAAIKRRVVVGARLRLTFYRGPATEIVYAEVTDVQRNGFWWRRTDGGELTWDHANARKPKEGVALTWWNKAGWTDIHSERDWTFLSYGPGDTRKPWISFEILEGR